MFTRRRLRSLMSVLLSSTTGVALIGIGANPAQADPNPIEDVYGYEVDAQGNPSNPGPFNDIVVYDNDGNQDDDDCVIEEEPQDDFTIVYPGAAVGIEGIDSPVVVWGNGTSGSIAIEPYLDNLPGDWPEEILVEDETCLYEESLKHLASWGFVVIAPNDGFVGSGTELQQAVDVATWINNVPMEDPADPADPGPYYQNLDLLSIAAAGHSQGAGGAINAAVADSRITSVLSVSTPDEAYCHPMWEEALNGIGWEFDCVTEATASQLDVPIFFVRGENDCFETDWLMRPFYSEYLDEIADHWLEQWVLSGLQNQFYLDLYTAYDEWADWVFDAENTPCISSEEENQDYFNEVSGAAVKGTVLADPPGEALDTHAGHISVREGLGYMTAWLAYRSGNPGYVGVEAAFCGTSPEIASNSGWTNWQAKSLPCS